MKIPYRYRGLVLLVLLVLLPVVVWRFALRESVSTWRDVRSLSQELASTISSTSGRDLFETSFLATSEMILSGKLLDSLRNCASTDIRVSGYIPVITQRETDMVLHTAQVTLTGPYHELLHVIHELEKKLPFCNLYSMEWRIETLYRTQSKQLFLTLYIQQLTITTHSNV